MDSPPSSPTSLVVSSPRRTLSLLRERRVFTSDSEEKKSPEKTEATVTSTTGFAAEHGPKTSEVYGFVGTITTVIATVIYLVWAYTPEPWLHSLGITYYPSKYWALAVPTFAMVTVVLVIVFYIGLNFMITPPPTSFNTMFDEYSRGPSKFVPEEGEEQPIEPISDIDIGHVNDLMFGQTSKLQKQPRSNPVQLLSPARRPSESGLCARRLMQYMYHQSHRPADNSITYWKKFVAEYFAPQAKKRWCLSLYNGVGNHVLGTFPQASMDAWQCGTCGSKSGKGFEATYEVLPRLNQIKFDHGVIDELLYLEMPREARLPSGMMVLEYEKAVQESVYEQIRVVREGQLRITFSQDLKILCWEFCARHHEELFPRRMMAPQVNQLLYVTQKYKAAVTESGASGLSAQDLQASCNMFVAAGRQLARKLELQSLNDLGFSKRYVRCLQISEVVNSMKDLINFGQARKMGPIDSLKNFCNAASKLHPQSTNETDQMVAAQNLSMEQNDDKLLSTQPGLGNHFGDSHPTTRFLNNTSQIPMPSNSYQYMSRNSPNHDQNLLRTDPSFTGLNPSMPSSFQSMSSVINQQKLGLPMQINMNQPSHANQHLQQHMIQQLLQDLMNKASSQQPMNSTSLNSTKVLADEVGCPRPSSAAMISGPGRNISEISLNEISGDVKGVMSSTSDASNPSTKSNNTYVMSSNYNAKLDALENMNLGDLETDILREFSEGGFQW